MYCCPCAHHEGTWVTGGVAPLIFGISTTCRSVVSITVCGRFIPPPRENEPLLRMELGGWMGPTLVGIIKEEKLLETEC